MKNHTSKADLGFQGLVYQWLVDCFGAVNAGDRVERRHRFLEEALELVQAAGCTSEEAKRTIDYVFSRPPGDMSQEVGGVMTTLAALCSSHGVDMEQSGVAELNFISCNIEAIRKKRETKPDFR